MRSRNLKSCIAYEKGGNMICKREKALFKKRTRPTQAQRRLPIRKRMGKGLCPRSKRHDDEYLSPRDNIEQLEVSESAMMK